MLLRISTTYFCENVGRLISQTGSVTSFSILQGWQKENLKACGMQKEMYGLYFTDQNTLLKHQVDVLNARSNRNNPTQWSIVALYITIQMGVILL